MLKYKVILIAKNLNNVIRIDSFLNTLPIETIEPKKEGFYLLYDTYIKY